MGDTIRVKIQAGGHEEEHNASISGMKWLQGGSGHGRQPNSGWRSSQAAGISEQFTLAIPIVPPGNTPTALGAITHRDYLYNVDSSMDGWWSGTWGLVRAYENARSRPVRRCRTTRIRSRRRTSRTRSTSSASARSTAKPRSINVVAILANDLLPKPAGVTHPAGRHRAASTSARRSRRTAARWSTTRAPRTVGGRRHRRRRAKSITLPTHFRVRCTTRRR